MRLLGSLGRANRCQASRTRPPALRLAPCPWAVGCILPFTHRTDAHYLQQERPLGLFSALTVVPAQRCCWLPLASPPGGVTVEGDSSMPALGLQLSRSSFPECASVPVGQTQDCREMSPWQMQGSC